MTPASTEQVQGLLAAGLLKHRAGDIASAEHLYGEVLKGHPGHFDALHLTAMCALERNSPAEALSYAQRALLADARQGAVHFTLARALAAAGQPQSALEHVQRAVELQADLAEAWLLRGTLLHPRSIALAAESYAKSIELRDDLPQAWNNLAAALREMRQNERALACVDRALALDPNYASARNNRGLVLLDAHRAVEACAEFKRAIEALPEFLQAYHNLGTALLEACRFAEAAEAFASLLERAPDFPQVWANLLRARGSACDWRDYECLTKELASRLERGELAEVPMSLLSHCGLGALQLTSARLYSAARYPEQPRPGRPGRRPDPRIHLAYLSGDFGNHAVSQLLAGVFERHDRSRFEITALSWDRVGEGSMRARLEAAFDRFIDITHCDDEAAVRVLEELGVDIAVDLTGHTLGQRTGIFARRAAPLQVNYLGFPATMGAPYMDYIIADEFLIPHGLEFLYEEKVARLPCFQPSDDRKTRPAPTSRVHQGLPEDAFVFASFNAGHKLTPRCFVRWLRVLEQAPDSILWLVVPEEGARQLRSMARNHSIDPKRLNFARRVGYQEHLARLPCADLILDTDPFTGGATTNDALFMGVPVLTVAGESFSARMSGSILSYLGLDAFVAGSPEDYESRAVAFAKNAARVRSASEYLKRSHHEHAYFDSDSYRRSLEAAYERMFQAWVAGAAPSAFTVGIPE